MCVARRIILSAAVNGVHAHCIKSISYVCVCVSKLQKRTCILRVRLIYSFGISQASAFQQRCCPCGLAEVRIQMLMKREMCSRPVGLWLPFTHRTAYTAHAQHSKNEGICLCRLLATGCVCCRHRTHCNTHTKPQNSATNNQYACIQFQLTVDPDVSFRPLFPGNKIVSVSVKASRE